MVLIKAYKRIKYPLILLDTYFYEKALGNYEKGEAKSSLVVCRTSPHIEEMLIIDL